MGKHKTNHDCCEKSEHASIESVAKFACPMHLNQTSNKPGVCPDCHMALEKTKIKSDHKHSGHGQNLFKRKFWLSLILTLPILYLSETVQNLLDYNVISFSYDQYVPALLGMSIFAYGGMVFIRSAKYELQARQPGMMTLVSLAIIVAFSYSTAITLGLTDGMDFWWELASLITIMLLGHWIEMASVDNAQSALKELAKLLPDEAERITESGTEQVTVNLIAVGDLIIVRPGGKIPVDGLIRKGETKVNESLLTGESQLIKKLIGDKVIAGAINDSGSITVEVKQTGQDTTLSGIVAMVEAAQKTKSRTQLIADRAAGYLFYYALSAAFVTALAWSLFSDQSTGYILQRVVAVLIIACPHALGLAIPLVTAISTTKAAKAGLLVRKRSALENARNIDVVVFDKTGTLTKGEQGLISIYADDEQKALQIAASIESHSEHPISKAIVRAAKAKNLKLETISGFSAMAGIGVKAKIGSNQQHIGGPAMLDELDVTLDQKFALASSKADKNGQTIVYLITENQVKAAFTIGDTIRDQSKSAIDSLHRSGIKSVLLTGDSEGVAKWVSSELGIDEYYSQILPGKKADVIKSLQKAGSKVAMVGDGVNDAVALTKADLGIAIGAGTDVAIESADIVLASNDPNGVNRIIKLSKKTYTKMVQNLIWAAGYNVIAVPLAAGMLYGHGIVLSPAIGAALMSLSTIIVAANAQLLRRTQLG